MHASFFLRAKAIAGETIPEPIISSIETKDDDLKFKGKPYEQYFG